MADDTKNPEQPTNRRTTSRAATSWRCRSRPASAAATGHRVGAAVPVDRDERRRSRRRTAPATPRSSIRPPARIPAVIIWPDAFGLRPAMRDMAKRLAAEGYSVLVPNPFYRMAKAPVLG